MKRNLIFLILAIHLRPLAQIPQLWGMTEQGGTYNYGTIYKVNGDGTGFTSIYSFGTGNTGIYPAGTLMRASNGLMYGFTSDGPPTGDGAFFSVDTNGTVTQIYNCSNVGGITIGNLIEASNGKLYALFDIVNDSGCIMSYDPVMNLVKKEKTFTGLNGQSPWGELVQATNGKMYGTTARGGSNNGGVIFCFEPITKQYNKIHDLPAQNYQRVWSDLVQANNGMLYGMLFKGGTDTLGEIFKVDPNTNTYTMVYNFTHATDTSGSGPLRSLYLANNGKLYGTTQDGGNFGMGVIFCFDPSNNSYTKVFDFDFTTGGYSHTNFIQGGDGKLYGTLQNGGSCYGIVFSFDISNNAYTVVHCFNNTDGAMPDGNSLVDYNKPLNSISPHHENSFSLYPSPANNKVTLSGIKNARSIEVTNMWGEIILQKIAATENKIELDLDNFISGLYNITIVSDKSRHTQKLVVQH